jgi:hypothetical protein
MRSKLLHVILALSFLTFLPVTSYACNAPPEAIISPPIPKWVHVSHSLFLDGSDSTDDDGDIIEWKWDFDDSDGVDWNNPDASGSEVYASYPTVGEYTVTLRVKDDGGLTHTDTCIVYVVYINLEMGPGEVRYIAVNNDDDNTDGDMDVYDIGVQTAEDDLVEILLHVETPKTTDKVTLSLCARWGDESSMKLWSHRDKQNLLIPDEYNNYFRRWTTGSCPDRLYAEGTKHSVVDSPYLIFTYTGMVGEVEYPVYRIPTAELDDFTVLEVDMDMDGVKDDDYTYPGVTEEITPGGFIPLNDLVKITLRKVLPTDLTGNVTFKAIPPAAVGTKIKIWQNETKTGSPLSLPKTYATPSALPKELWVEGIDAISSPSDFILAMEYSIAGKTFEDKIKITVYTVNEVTWETYDSNPLLDWCPKNTGSKRIFPGKQTFNDPSAADRKKVTVKATITPAVAGANVYFDWWDVDDPSTDWFPLDTTSTDGFDNKGSGESLSATSETTNASGEARVTFTVSMQPGDNFRITASASETQLGEVTQFLIDYGNLPSGVILSRMLTTWRKLWIEQDSMGAVPEIGNEKNHVAGTASGYEPYDQSHDRTWIHLGQNLPAPFDDVNQFKYGIYFTVTKTYTTRQSTGYESGEDKVKVSGDPSGDGVPMNYKLYDDDETTLPSYPGLGSWSSVYEDAYIELNYLPESYHDEVTFYRNLHSDDVSLGWGDWNNSYDCPSQSNFWTTLVVSLFQPQTIKDFDPDTESYICGQTVLVGNESGIYLETIRDGGKSIGKMIAHEIGHTGGVFGHWCLEACLMKEDANGNFGEDFCNDCLLEFREDSNW